MFKQSRLKSILFNKCPRCHQGQFFVSNNPYQLKVFDKMNARCSHCGESFEREVGFYYGAMYVSYGLAVAIGVGLFLLMVVLLSMDVLAYLIVYTISIILLSPLLFRKARLVWINLFVGFRPNFSSKK